MQLTQKDYEDLLMGCSKGLRDVIEGYILGEINVSDYHLLFLDCATSVFRSIIRTLVSLNEL